MTGPMGTQTGPTGAPYRSEHRRRESDWWLLRVIACWVILWMALAGLAGICAVVLLAREAFG